jgi:hypothetical protein
VVNPPESHSNMRFHNIAFVGSTLPVRYLLENIQKERIGELIVSSVIFLNSYQHLQTLLPSLKISVQPKRYSFRLFYLAYLIVLAKILRRKIYIFHECCWPMLDLIIRLIAPKGYFIPIANLGSFIKLSHAEFGLYLNQMSISIIGQIIQKRFFEMYKHKADGGDGWVHVLVCKHYPSSITVLKHLGINKSGTHKEGASAQAENPSMQKSILFLIGREPVTDSYLSGLYSQLIAIAIENGYAVSIKDHPNKGARLNLEPEACTMIDPTIPAELLVLNYSIVVGVASASLASFRGRTISLLKMIKEMPSVDFEIRERYLRSISTEILFLDDVQDFAAFLKKV